MMKVITYLAFTVLSVVMQFVLMDLIQDKLRIDDDKIEFNTTSENNKIGFNTTNRKRSYSDVGEYPQALYYRSPNIRKDNSPRNAKTYTNSTISEMTLDTTTDFTSTLIDLLYIENSSSTEDAFTTVTESFEITEEFDNVTEVSIFGKKNSTESIPKNGLNVKGVIDCNCNLLYKVCDINCCCDSDCTNAEREVFDCSESIFNTRHSDGDNFCYSQLYLMGSSIDNNLFCVVKNNLPEKRKIIHEKHDPAILNKAFKWHSSRNRHVNLEFKNKFNYGDPIWVLQDGSIFYLDLPSNTVNNYCNDRKPIKFLRDAKVKCNVKLSDLEALQILRIVEKTSVISVTGNPFNTSDMNCSTLHCTNWTTILCDESICTKYNKSLHDPLCTESVCSHLALRVDFIFHYHEKKIMNATVKLYTQKVSLYVPLIEQVINVKFVIANKSLEDIVEMSGNPGYITGLPVIVSYFDANHTDNYYNTRNKPEKYLTHLSNNNGICVQSNITNDYLLFGVNKRKKCRYVHILQNSTSQRNESETCKTIQDNILNLVGINRKLAVSPMGNVRGLKDEDWISTTMQVPDDLLYGQYIAQKTKLHCYNLINRFSFIFTYADTSDDGLQKKMKILSVNISGNSRNVTFNVEDVSAVLTMDVTFLDETKPSVYEYAAGPQLNIHLPKDFFFPFPSNGASTDYNTKLQLWSVFVCTFLSK